MLGIVESVVEGKVATVCEVATVVIEVSGSDRGDSFSGVGGSISWQCRI